MSVHYDEQIKQWYIRGTPCAETDIIDHIGELQRAGMEAEKRVAELEKHIKYGRILVHRYRTETPLGYQPHMIAHIADDWLIATGDGGE